MVLLIKLFRKFATCCVDFPYGHLLTKVKPHINPVGIHPQPSHNAPAQLSFSVNYKGHVIKCNLSFPNGKAFQKNETPSEFPNAPFVVFMIPGGYKGKT